MADIRIAMAQRAHDMARSREAQAGRYRAERDQIIRALRAENPKTWTYERLASAIGCSPELIAHIVKKERGDE